MASQMDVSQFVSWRRRCGPSRHSIQRARHEGHGFTAPEDTSDMYEKLSRGRRTPALSFARHPFDDGPIDFTLEAPCARTVRADSELRALLGHHGSLPNPLTQEAFYGGRGRPSSRCPGAFQGMHVLGLTVPQSAAVVIKRDLESGHVATGILQPKLQPECRLRVGRAAHSVESLQRECPGQRHNPASVDTMRTG